MKQEKDTYNKQKIKIWKALLFFPFSWLNKRFQKYKYEITLNQYQNQLKKLEKEIAKLATEKPEGYFWNKFCFIISCGRYNNYQNQEIKEQKKVKLNEIKQKIYELRNLTRIKSEATTAVEVDCEIWNKTDSRFLTEIQCQNKSLKTAVL